MVLKLGRIFRVFRSGLHFASCCCTLESEDGPASKDPTLWFNESRFGVRYDDSSVYAF
jgi:hypothetical protein